MDQGAEDHTIGLIGLGVVGRAVHALFSDAGLRVVAWDAGTRDPYPEAELATSPG